MDRTVTRQVTGGRDAATAPAGHSDHAGGPGVRRSAAGPGRGGFLPGARRAATVLAAKTIRPDYISGDSFRHLVITDDKVTALAKTADEAARAAGPSARRADLGYACVGPGFIDTHIHALQAAADVAPGQPARRGHHGGPAGGGARGGRSAARPASGPSPAATGMSPSCARAACRPGRSWTRWAFPGRSCCGGEAISPCSTRGPSRCWGRRASRRADAAETGHDSRRRR